MRPLVAACALVVMALPASAGAQDATRRLATPPLSSAADEPARASRWQPHWQRFDATNAVITVVAESAAWAVYLAEPVTEARWTSTLPLDDELRSVLRISDQDVRRAVVTASDALLLAMIAWPLVVDSVLLAGATRGDWDVAAQMALIDIEVLAVAHMATWLTSRLTGRVRPEALDCAIAGTCADTGSGPVASFVGGHSLFAFASAGLTCTHHLQSPWIAGNIEAAAMTCGASLAFATAMGFMRLAVDRHWGSDIAIGSALGAAIGFGLPHLLHYGRPPSARPGRAGADGRFFLVTPGVSGDPRGATVAGAF